MEGDYASEDDTAAMAAMMGFSGFGTQGPAKKRKYNAATDAVIDDAQLAKIDRGGKKGSGSGGNNVPLGRTRVLGEKATEAVIGDGEIDLEDDDGDERDLDGVPEVPGVEKEVRYDDEGPVYLDTSRPAPTTAASRVVPAYGISATTGSNTPAVPSARGLASLPSRPPPFSNQNPSHMPSRPPRGHGQRNELWYVDYYDPSFNENPWSKREQELGLEPVGTWVERPIRT